MQSFNPSPETQPALPTLTDPDDIHLYTSPWVTGTRADGYYGALAANAYYEKSSELENAIITAFCDIQKQCSALGGNSLVGVEVTIDPYGDPPYVHVVGTGAKLVPLF